MKHCKICNVNLNDDNWSIGLKNNKTYYCNNCNKKRAREYYYKNKEKKIKYQKNYYEHNKNEIIEKISIYNKLNKEKRKTWCKKDRLKNNQRVNNHTAKRRANKIKAIPSWADLKKIAIVYEKAKWLESITGLKYHVDHIIPLQGKNVCGLHTWENLQIIEAALNLSKGCKHESY